MTPLRRLLPAFALLNLPISVSGQGTRWERQVDTKLARARGTLVQSGYVPVPTNSRGALNNGDTAAVVLDLVAGSAYAIVGVCDDDCTNLDLQLFGATGYEIDAAKGTGAAPIIRVTPRGSTTYRLITRMTGCGLNPCWYGVSIYRRGGTP